MTFSAIENKVYIALTDLRVLGASSVKTLVDQPEIYCHKNIWDNFSYTMHIVHDKSKQPRQDSDGRTASTGYAQGHNH